MKTIKKIWIQISESRIITGITCYDKNGYELFTYQNKDGLFGEALTFYKLTQRKNSAFKLSNWNNSYNKIYNKK